MNAMENNMNMNASDGVGRVGFFSMGDILPNVERVEWNRDEEKAVRDYCVEKGLVCYVLSVDNHDVLEVMIRVLRRDLELVEDVGLLQKYRDVKQRTSLSGAVTGVVARIYFHKSKLVVLKAMLAEANVVDVESAIDGTTFSQNVATLGVVDITLWRERLAGTYGEMVTPIYGFEAVMKKGDFRVRAARATRVVHEQMVLQQLCGEDCQVQVKKVKMGARKLSGASEGDGKMRSLWGYAILAGPEETGLLEALQAGKFNWKAVDDVLGSQLRTMSLDQYCDVLMSAVGLGQSREDRNRADEDMAKRQLVCFHPEGRIDRVRVAEICEECCVAEAVVEGVSREDAVSRFKGHADVMVEVGKASQQQFVLITMHTAEEAECLLLRHTIGGPLRRLLGPRLRVVQGEARHQREARNRPQQRGWSRGPVGSRDTGGSAGGTTVGAEQFETMVKQIISAVRAEQKAEAERRERAMAQRLMSMEKRVKEDIKEYMDQQMRGLLSGVTRMMVQQVGLVGNQLQVLMLQSGAEQQEDPIQFHGAMSMVGDAAAEGSGAAAEQYYRMGEELMEDGEEGFYEVPYETPEQRPVKQQRVDRSDMNHSAWDDMPADWKRASVAAAKQMMEEGANSGGEAAGGSGSGQVGTGVGPPATSLTRD